ncbi:MAG: Gfo/Idh/MocA family oxidoreductase [Verrucomicrobiia bacterium]|jgi:predicted dehydrogenase
MKRARVGLMGCGTVAMYGHLPALAAAQGLELAAVFDPDSTRLKAAEDEFAVPHAFIDAEPFFTSGLDAVVITSPAGAHLQNVCNAARHGKHVLCEKPLALTEVDAERMIEEMAHAERMLFTSFVYRFSPVALEIKRLINEGAIGRVASLRLVYNWDCHGKFEMDGSGHRVIQKRREDRMLEGGPMVDCGVHQIDLARWWLGSEVVRQHAHAAWADEYRAPDHVWLHLDHADGVHTMVEMSYSYGHTAAQPIGHFCYEIIGADGVIRYDRERQLFEVRNSAGTRSLPWNHEKNFAGTYAAFARALETGEPGDLATGADGLIATRIARTATEQVIADRR